MLVRLASAHYFRLAEIGAVAVIVVGLILWAWLHFGTRLVHRWKASRRVYRNSEAAFFARLRNASHAGNAIETYSLLLRWLHRFRPGIGLGQFLSHTADAELTMEVESLAATLYGQSAVPWSGKRMIGSLERVRARSHQEWRLHRSLPPLNPARR